MANEQTIFKARIAKSWQTEFPFLKQVDLDETPRVPEGCNYLCDFYGESRARYYFVRLIFSPKRRGELSIGITVSPSPKRSILEHTLDGPSLSPTSIGMFGVWKFLNRPRFVWALADLEGEQTALFTKLGAAGINFRSSRSSNVWRPSTYDQAFDKIADEAVAHVNLTLRSSVFPVLQISPDEPLKPTNARGLPGGK